MPLVGLIEPSHAERDSDMPGRLPVWHSIDDILGLALANGPKWGPWSFELLQAVVNQSAPRDYISTTALLGCLRGTVLERREDYVEDVSRYYAAMRGTYQHAILEDAARPGSLAEWRFFTTIDGVGISCSPDLITPDDGTLWDYKVTENPPQFGSMWRSHKLQLNFNRFITNNAEAWEPPKNWTDPIPVDPRNIVFRNLAIVYLGPKEPKVIVTEKTVNVTSPNGRQVKKKVSDVWSDKAVLEELRPRMHALRVALDAYPAWPDELTDAPGFEGPPGWACPGYPYCKLPMCLAKRYPDGLVW